MDVAPPAVPGPGWQRLFPRLSGICGSDLATVDGRSSRWFEPIVSFPFVPGHEVVAETEDGRRVVIEPVLACEARGIHPLCAACADGRRRQCANLTGGHLTPGLQTGYCHETGGGWSLAFVAHETQLHAVPDGLPDEAAVLVEPAACAVHAALTSPGPPRHLEGQELTVVVIGAGTLGLCTIAAIARFREDVDAGHCRGQAPTPARPRHPPRGHVGGRTRRAAPRRQTSHRVVDPEQRPAFRRGSSGCRLRRQREFPGGRPGGDGSRRGTRAGRHAGTRAHRPDAALATRSDRQRLLHIWP